MQAMKLTWRLSVVSRLFYLFSAHPLRWPKKGITVGLIRLRTHGDDLAEQAMMDKLSQALGMPVVPFVAATIRSD